MVQSKAKFPFWFTTIRYAKIKQNNSTPLIVYLLLVWFSKRESVNHFFVPLSFGRTRALYEKLFFFFCRLISVRQFRIMIAVFVAWVIIKYETPNVNRDGVKKCACNKRHLDAWISPTSRVRHYQKSYIVYPVLRRKKNVKLINQKIKREKKQTNCTVLGRFQSSILCSFLRMLHQQRIYVLKRVCVCATWKKRSNERISWWIK